MEAGNASDGALIWQVAYTRPRCEKLVAGYCLARRMEHYLPLRLEIKVYQRRKARVLKPLFPGYVFARLNSRLRLALLQSGQVVRLLPVPDEERFVFELSQVRAALDANPALMACRAISKGQRARITAGPFQGLEGVVEAVRNEVRVVLNVDFIGQGVPVEVAFDMLEHV